MLCDHCGSSVKPVVSFDIDGVLGDYHNHFIRFCVKYWAHTSVKPWAYDGSIEFEEWLGLTKIEYREAKLAYRQGGTKRWMPAYQGAMEAVRTVRNAGADIWISTSRPWQRLDNIDPDTREWLSRNAIRFDGLLYGDDKYHQLVQAVDPARIVGVVDDLDYQCRLAEKAGVPFFQVARQHNSTCVVEPRGTLVEAVDWAIQNVRTWRRNYER